MYSKLVTLERFILEQERTHPEATGVLTSLLYDIALAAKIIAREIRRAGLNDILGEAGSINVQGERQMKLDLFANDAFIQMNSYTGRVALMATEELAAPVQPTPLMKKGKYVLIFDPLDGSSNIDVNVSVGTIFGIYQRQTPRGTLSTLADCLQSGRKLVAAGYIVYGSSTMMVYSTGNGVHGFTLEPSMGEFLLSHPYIHIPETPKYFSANLSYQRFWSEGVRQYTQYLQTIDEHEALKPLSTRYVGALVADFHRNLLQGGVFYYPLLYRDPQNPQPKMRLLCEAAPMAYIAEQAGGYASDGTQNILDITPRELHQRVPLFIGNRALVEKAEEYLRQYG
ncbi:MAG: class 1 fructose-bisphosphatase [Chloroflexota bacterium]|nr:class 1 fructose-bisphosphatase [Chloroflexota bacterium]